MAIPEDQIKGNIRYVKITKDASDEYYGFEVESGGGGGQTTSGGNFIVTLKKDNWIYVQDTNSYVQRCEAPSEGDKLTDNDVCVIGLLGNNQTASTLNIMNDWSKIYYAYTDCTSRPRSVVFYALSPTELDTITAVVKW